MTSIQSGPAVSGRVGCTETGSREPGPASRPGPTGFDPARVENIANRLGDLERKAIMHRESASEACMSWATAERLYEIGLTERNARFLRLTALGTAVRSVIQCDSGSRPEGENSRSEVEGEARQSGHDSGIAQGPSHD